MKIGIKVSDISSLLNLNNLKSKDIVMKNIKMRLFKQIEFDSTLRQIDPSRVDQIVSDFRPVAHDHKVESIESLNNSFPKESFSKIMFKEFDTFFVYCLEHELVRKAGIVVDKKNRISESVKYFIPTIDLVHCQFYMLLGDCRRYLLDEFWDDGHFRKKYIKFNDRVVQDYVQKLRHIVCEITQ